MNMRKFILILSLFCILFTTVAAQSSFSVVDGESSIAYSLPKTELLVELEIEKTTQKPGLFYPYSERYLATNKIITENRTTYKLLSISVKTNPVPDFNRTYVVNPGNKSILSHVTVNSDGLLCGINVPPTNGDKPEILSSIPKQEKSETTWLLPLGEEYLMAGSTAKLAEGAAKQIYRIRESRMSILTGDLEHLPADGSSLQTMTGKLDQLESDLTELFIGKTKTEIEKHQIRFTPEVASNNSVFFRLSAIKGIVPVEDLTGNPYYLTIEPEKIKVNTNSSKKKNTLASLNTILPALTKITIGNGSQELYSNQFSIPQFGVIVPYADELLSEIASKVWVDYQTGRLLNIEKSSLSK